MSAISLFTELSLLQGPQAACANVNCLATVNSDLANVGLPGSVGLYVGVRVVVTEHNTLATQTTFCHFYTS